MPGKRYLLDTNAAIALLNGSSTLLSVCEQAQWLGLSVITLLEFNGFAGVSDRDVEVFRQLVARVEVVDLSASDTDLLAKISAIRKTRAVKLPDAIVAASASTRQATLLSNDTQLLKLNATMPGLAVEAFEA